MRGARPEMTRSQESSPTAGAHRARSTIYVLLTIGVAAALWKISPARGPAGSRAVVASDRSAIQHVRYVGDEACVRCHSNLVASYRKHSMGRSLTPVDQSPKVIGDTADDRNRFEAQGFEYSVERRDGRVFHRKTRRDQHGRVIAQADGEIRFTLGSGSRGLSFLIDRDGYLFQSPIAWYAQHGEMGSRAMD